MSISKDLAVGIKWSFIAQFGRQLLQILTTIILVSILPPKDFGLMGIALIVTGFLKILENPGTSASVIQRSEVSQRFLSSIFWLNIFLGIVFTGLVYLSSQYVANFFAEPRVDSILKFLSVIFFISAFGNLQKGIAEKRNQFDLLAKVESTAIFVSSVIVIVAALNGLGVYSLVLQAIALTLLRALLLMLFVDWRPQLLFNWHEVTPVINYTINLTGANILGYLMRNADNFIIGKFLGAESLGYYAIAYKIIIFPLQNIVDTVKRVLFPILSRIQNDIQQSKRIYLDLGYAVFLFIIPIMLGIFAVNKTLVLTIWGEEWRTVITLIYFLAPVGILQSLIRMSGAILAANGKTNVLLYINLISTLVVITAFIIGVNWGLTGVAVGYLIANILIIYPALKLPYNMLDLSVLRIMKDISFILLSAVVMVLTVFGIQFLFNNNDYFTLLLLVLTGSTVFASLIWKIDSSRIKAAFKLAKDSF